jgi:hypothetical protein
VSLIYKVLKDGEREMGDYSWRETTRTLRGSEERTFAGSWRGNPDEIWIGTDSPMCIAFSDVVHKEGRSDEALLVALEKIDAAGGTGVMLIDSWVSSWTVDGAPHGEWINTDGRLTSKGMEWLANKSNKTLQGKIAVEPQKEKDWTQVWEAGLRITNKKKTLSHGYYGRYGFEKRLQQGDYRFSTKAVSDVIKTVRSAIDKAHSPPVKTVESLEIVFLSDDDDDSDDDPADVQPLAGPAAPNPLPTPVPAPLALPTPVPAPPALSDDVVELTARLITTRVE